ncbi:MAG: DUF3307 domain-containing protein [Hyphomicrobiaceae bacterium]
MPVTAETILLAMTVLLIKHWVADFLLQTIYQVKNKGRYGHPGGLLHSAFHVVCTLPVFLVLPPSTPQQGLGLLAAEYLFHYHVDWLKEQLNKRLELKPDMSGFWYLLGLDQLVHGLTYVTIIWVLLPG